MALSYTFVCPWYGPETPGGAERAAHSLVVNLAERGHDVSVLTTCARDFYNWEDYHNPGTALVEGIPVTYHRVNRRNRDEFDRINLMLLAGRPVSAWEESIFLRNIVCSDDLMKSIWRQRRENVFIFSPYMFGTSYWGASLIPDQTIMLPCLHDEPYLALPRYQKMLQSLRLLLFYSQGEMNLATRVLKRERADRVLGLGVDPFPIPSEAERIAFREHFSLNGPFFFIPGRKQPEKNTDLIVSYFRDMHRMSPVEAKLVFSGPGELSIPAELAGAVIDAGFLTKEHLAVAYAEAIAVLIPSSRESFSFTMYESWISGTPVLVNSACEATAIPVQETNAGVIFSDSLTFGQAIRYLLAMPPVERTQIGQRGQNRVLEQNTWDSVISRFIDYSEAVFS